MSTENRNTASLARSASRRVSNMDQRYCMALCWAADENEPEDMDPDSVESDMFTMMIADVWGLAPEDVAAEIIRLRRDAQ
jgi:hypothetical protein